MIGGPAVGGLLIAMTGLLTTYLVDVASFIISLVSIGIDEQYSKTTICS